MKNIIVIAALLMTTSSFANSQIELANSPHFLLAQINIKMNKLKCENSQLKLKLLDVTPEIIIESEEELLDSESKFCRN